jgi:hypothetical protein
MEISKYLKISFLKEKLSEPVHIAPLVVFRIIFGAVMLGAVIRFLLKGWVYELYIKPEFYFSYYGFEWVKPMGAAGMYIVFALMALSFLLIIFGYYYRLAAVTAFLTFTYVELIDKSNYLNHYYFVSVVCFLLIFLPAHKYFSLDAVRKPAIGTTEVPRYTISAIKLQLAIVYIFAGIAKLNYDWLYRAMPLKIWLPANAHLPLIGGFLDYEWVAYFFSWFGAVYDLFIVFFLMNSRTRPVAYAFVILFHLMTKWLFPIGMFPYVMIFCTLIFFSEPFHKKVIEKLKGFNPGVLKLFAKVDQPAGHNLFLNKRKSHVVMWMLGIFFFLQILLPWRFLLYPGNLFWTEQGYRFSWRVMLMEKAGTAFFYVKDPKKGFEAEVMNDQFLTKNQEKMMATQPDMILQYAHLLKEKYEAQGIKNPQVRVESYVTLNGSGSRMFLDSSVDLTKERESLLPKAWILPFEEKKSK